LRRFAGNPDRKNERNFDLQCVLSYKRGSWCKGHGREMNTEGERRKRTRERKGKLIDYEVSCDNTAAQSLVDKFQGGSTERKSVKERCTVVDCWLLLLREEIE